MKVVLLVIGKTEEKYLLEGISIYEKRLKHYLPFELLVIPALKNNKNNTVEKQKEMEGNLFLASLTQKDHLILLDEKGKEVTSPGFANYLQQNMNNGIKRLIFVVGGPYGFSSELIKRSNGMISLSKLTFSHQMVRLFFVEQLYRAMTILKNEPYHHQ